MNNKEIMEKISELEQQIAELKEAAQKQDEPKAWKPDVEEDYWYISEHMTATDTEFSEDNFDNRLIRVNNCFRTKERADEVAKKIRMLLKLERYRDMFCPDYVPDWEDGNQHKYCVYYGMLGDRWHYNEINFLRDAVQVYFDSEETAQKVCDLLNGEGEENDSNES